jgi:uncharacterized protein (TIGR02611 family)
VSCPYPDHVVEARRSRVVDLIGVVRERIRSRRGTHILYRIVVGLLGVALTLGGLVLVPLPGPGWLIVLAGLAVLGSEFDPARRVLEFARRRLAAWTTWLTRQGVAVQAVVMVATLGCVLIAMYAVAATVGVPHWVPDALVPRLPGLEHAR